MKTDELIHALAADHAPRGTALEWRLAGAVLAGFAVAAAFFAVMLGPREDFAEVLGEPRFAFKLLLTLLLAAVSLGLGMRLARPAAGARPWSLALAAVLVVLALAVLIELIVVPPASWPEELIGSNAELCLASIPLLALPILVAMLAMLRRGAPLRPGLAGAVAGLCAGALGAALYATHCIDDSPLFVAAWYSLAVAIVAIVGALAGRALLRW
jgi:hypothetical protein